ncbi:hypothetical protein E6O75_ATG05620 [Venturia nashicola]|uniref:Uncharacterized protein n=1 Tax=Venturia nashicola TaxID=86259 RepID=A0A4Z1NZZ4_9PEZI|nr:hypothetical protein E6O75_ATG05620 [Venturia nashicola]
MRVPLEKWGGIVDVIILPEVLTPSNATIVLMRPDYKDSANLLWIFPKTMTEVDFMGIRPNMMVNVTAEYIAKCLEYYKVPTEGGEDSSVFRHRWDFRAGTSIHSSIHTSILKLHLNGNMYTKNTEWKGAIPPPLPVPKAKKLVPQPPLKTGVFSFPGRLLEPRGWKHECKSFNLKVDTPDDGDSDTTNSYADPGSDPGSDANSKAADRESKAPTKTMPKKVNEPNNNHKQQKDNGEAEEAFETEVHVQSDLWKRVKLHKQKQERAGVNESELTVEAVLSEQEAWEQICKHANVHDLSESMVGSTGGTIPDDHGSAAANSEREPLEVDVEAEVHNIVETQKQQQTCGQEGDQSCEQIQKQTNSCDPFESTKEVNAHIASDHQEVPWNRWQVKADRRTNAQIRRDNRHFQNQYVLMELCKAAHDQTDEVKMAKMQRLRYAKMARKNGMDVPQLPYCPIRQDPEYKLAVETAENQQLLPTRIVEAATWATRQANWATRARQGDACEDLLYQERMDARDEARARWKMRKGSRTSFMDKFKAYEGSEVEGEPMEKESITQEQLEKITRRRKAARKLWTSALRSKRPNAEQQIKVDEALRQVEEQQSTSEDQWSSTEESSSMWSSFHQEVEQATRRQSVSSAQSSPQSSVFEEKHADPVGGTCILSSVAETQLSVPEEQSSIQEQKNECMIARASETQATQMKAFLENSPMFGKSLIPNGPTIADETVHQTEEKTAGPKQRPSMPEPRRLSKRAYVDDEEVKDESPKQESPTKRGRVDSVAFENKEDGDQVRGQD